MCSCLLGNKTCSRTALNSLVISANGVCNTDWNFKRNKCPRDNSTKSEHRIQYISIIAIVAWWLLHLHRVVWSSCWFWVFDCDLFFKTLCRSLRMVWCFNIQFSQLQVQNFTQNDRCYFNFPINWHWFSNWCSCLIEETINPFRPTYTVQIKTYLLRPGRHECVAKS